MAARSLMRGLTALGLGSQFQITDAVVAANVATITTYGQHNFIVGNRVVVQGVSQANFNGSFAITAVTTPNTFSYALVTANVTIQTSGIATIGVLATGAAADTFSLPQGLTGHLANYTWTVEFPVIPATCQVDLQGSIDGVDWYQIDTYTGIAATMRHVVNKPLQMLRYNVITLTGASAAVSGTLRLG